MKIKKITHIKEYKSFIDFKWADFCKDRTGVEQAFNRFNLIFGENGCGKTSICEILKDITKHKNFSDTCDKPNSIQLLIDGNNHNYANQFWDNYLPEQSILFFDQVFIDENVHTNGERSNERNKHSQNAGKLIIDLDAEANRLKADEAEKANELKVFDTTNATKLNHTFLPKELEIYVSLKDKSDEELDALKNSTNDIHKSLLNDIEQLKFRRNQVSSITSYTPPENIGIIDDLPTKEEVKEIFSRKIETIATEDVSLELNEHISKHKEFIESGMQILDEADNKDSCPFCQQSLTTQVDLIKAYSEFFNQKYKEQKQKFIEDIDNIKGELIKLRTEVSQLQSRTSLSFNSISKFWIEYSLSTFVSEQTGVKNDIKDEFIEREDFEKRLISLTELDILDKMIQALEELKRIDHDASKINPSIDSLYDFIDKIRKLIEEINGSQNRFKRNISDFKIKYSNIESINEEIKKKENEFTEVNDLKAYLEAETHKKITEQNTLREQKATLVNLFNAAKEALKTYVQTQAPTLVLEKMMTVLNKFNLSFKLEPHRVSASTADVPFSFKIIDKRGKERNIKTGLSEGERQLISLAFFFALNESVADKANKVLVFDDPITSLDASNLKILSDVIYEQVSLYSQVFVFTHHPLFFKYLGKNQTSGVPNPIEFGIIKNTAAFKGSFIYMDSKFDLHAELKACHQAIVARAVLGTLSVEEAALSYGHLLRLAVERFIKNDLLLWDLDKFPKITEELKDAKNKLKLLSDANLDVIDKVYKYCNYSNFLHADLEAASALTELLQHIDSYITIVDTVRNLPPTPVAPIVI